MAQAASEVLTYTERKNIRHLAKTFTQKDKTMEALLTTKQAASALGVSYEDTRKALSSGALKGQKTGKSWRVSSSEVNRFKSETKTKRKVSEIAKKEKFNRKQQTCTACKLPKPGRWLTDGVCKKCSQGDSITVDYADPVLTTEQEVIADSLIQRKKLENLLNKEEPKSNSKELVKAFIDMMSAQTRLLQLLIQ